MTRIIQLKRAPNAALGQLRCHFPGVMACSVVALAAGFLSEHHGGPQLLYALLLGLAFNFLVTDERLVPGIVLCGRTALRVGVALLGARITLEQVAALGMLTVVTVIAAVLITIATGVLLARALGRSREEGILSGCAVGICGASAALAVSAVLPATRENERLTLLAVVGVTILSTLAMVVYPFFVTAIGLDPHRSGIFLGATVHDVAQAVAAAMILGPDSADTATIVKLLRVALLAPIAAVVALIYRRADSFPASGQPPLFPRFLLGFALLVVAGSLGWIAAPATAVASSLSKWLIVVAIAAAGMKTDFAELIGLGWIPIVMLVMETAVIAVFTLALLWTRT